MQRPRRILTFTTLYPNAARPAHGVFVENRLRHLLASGGVEARVVAPVPWFPPALARLFPDYVDFVRAPRLERRFDLSISHPRYPVLPKLGMTVAPALLFASVLPTFRRLQTESGDFDLIDAHYFYPDGVAAVLLGARLRKPVVITARGSDVNLISQYALPRRMIRAAAERAAGLITVSQALKDKLVELGVPPGKVEVLRNGVDLATFHPRDRATIRHGLQIRGPTLLSVGNLVENKGHHLVIEALASLPQHSLLIAGQGPERGALERLAARLQLVDRVRFLGAVSHEHLADFYSAADLLVLASSREGWPNVLLEAMACGTPVLATNVGGIPEVVAAPEAGRLLTARTSAAIVAGVDELFRQPPDRGATRRYAERFSWDATTEGQLRLFREIIPHP